MNPGLTYETIQLQMDGPVVTVRLDRPDVRNAFNARMIAELTDAFLELGRNELVRAIVLSGNGKSFSAGADVAYMQASLDATREQNIEDARRMSDMFHAIDCVPQVVFARVHGAALGGGMGLLAVCDIVVAAEGTVFGFTEGKLGIIPAVISRFVLPKIGMTWARALFPTAERFGPDLARQIGLVHWVAAEDDLDDMVQSRVREVLSSGPAAVRSAKAFLDEAMRMDPAQFRDFTSEWIADLRASAEGQEGLRAFLEKRTPSWGR